ncbi:MAG TPA: NADH-quinone oxidoreductase subunit D [Myxococcales bacterium]|nr:NADH-quinone oxidoreductase subunit D [Myxococcales bacterium]HIK84749.1 NADH-quinone oxidoreductase subunit D [Myxococcales bacterium]
MSESEMPNAEQCGPTLSEALGFSGTILEVGYTHPGVRRVLSMAGGTTGFLVSLDDERITDLEVEIGIGHRGFEKEAEAVPWHRALPYVARLGYVNGLMAEVAYCLAVEGLARVSLPDRAIWLRTLASEIARISDHFSRLTSVSASIGLRSAENVSQQGESFATKLLDALTGGAFAGWVRLGGVAGCVPDQFEAFWGIARREIEASLVRFDAAAISNPSCQKRLQDVAVFSADDCVAWSVTGPSIRAAGTPMDVRREAPYLAYASIDFDIPIGESGDCFDRLLVVVEEVRQSLRIIDQCLSLLATLGPGAVRLAEPGWCDPEDVAPSERAQLALCGPNIAPGEYTASIESSTGELGFFIVSDGNSTPRRIRCRAASFHHAQAMPQMLRGALLDDLLPTAAILHLVSGECDR